MCRQEKYQVVVIRSTLLPFTTRTKVIPFLEHHCRLVLNEDYGICYNPEFLREEHFLDDAVNPPVSVIGENDKRSGDIVSELYAPFQSPQIRTTTENAEAIKCFSNAYNAMKISFFNKLYLIAESCGLDHEIISKTLPKSTTAIRLPEYGIKGGYPYGGKCLPKDLAAVINFVKERELCANLFEEIAKINDEIGNIYACSRENQGFNSSSGI
jgi:UDPglucose 6-dehydrogenase